MSSHNTGNNTASLQQKLKTKQQDGVEINNEEPVEPEVFESLSPTELRQKLTEAEEKATQSWEKLLRIQAEMDNVQRRAERDLSNAHKYALEKFVLELLPIVDGLERAVISQNEEKSGVNALMDGVQMTLNMLYGAFEKFGIQQVNPQSAAFNPELHQAVSTETDPHAKPGTVLVVLQKGYLLNNRLIRPALVVVAKN